MTNILLGAQKRLVTKVSTEVINKNVHNLGRLKLTEIEISGNQNWPILEIRHR